MQKLLLALPKGSLQEATVSIMQKAGFRVRIDSRSYIPQVDDPEIEARLLRAQEISRCVETGTLDAGITGLDWIMENGSRVVDVAELIYAKQGMKPVRWVLAVPEKSPIRKIKDLQGKRIATEAVNLTLAFLKRHGVKATVEFSWGATEIKPAMGLADAVVELTETGSSLRAHNLRVVETVLESTTRLIANKTAWKNAWKRAKINQIATLLQGALRAENKVLIKMNAPARKVTQVTRILPSLHAPTISNLDSKGWVAIESVVDETVVREIICRLKKAGAEGIIELPLNKVIP